MAPDINTLEPSTSTSPTSNSTARRQTQMPPPPPPVPATALSPTMTSNEQTPLRHPHPLTPADLVLCLETESEALVNRLSRELSALRAQTASVASNTSLSSTSTSASFNPACTHQLTSATHPTPSRRHRSSSSLSARSIPNTPSTSSHTGSTTTNLSTQAHAGSTVGVPIGGVSQASYDRAAAAAGTPLSRQPSTTRSGTSTPARQSLETPRHPSYTLPHRPALSRDPSNISQASLSTTAAIAGSPLPPTSPPHLLTSQHYVDTAAHRAEMEAVKAENEALRQRVRALERALQVRRRDSSTSDVSRPVDVAGNVGARHRESMTDPTRGSAIVAAWDGGVGGVASPRERSESLSTTASSSRRLVGVGGPGDEEVRVGESAGSMGVGR